MPAHHCGGPAQLPPPVVFLPGQKDERVLAARWPRAGHLLLTCSPLEAPEGATHSPPSFPTTSLTLP